MSRIVFCGFGKLGVNCLLALLQNNYKINFILTHFDMAEESVDRLAKDYSIPFFYNDLRKDNDITEIDSVSVKDILVSINYRYILEEDFFLKFKYALNIHGSLLPKYRGRTPHVWSIINGEKEAGITCHSIDKGIDTGDIIHQIVVKIDENDTGYTLLKKYESLYSSLLLKSLSILKRGCSFIPQDEEKATYFGKREPLMGYIDFYNNVTNIINFIRAQAYPYPGAYCYLPNGDKLIIDEVEVSDLNDNQNFNIGVPKKINDIYYVKCDNVILTILKYR